ncbi:MULTISPECIES: hypothetical protein [Acinetobacter]|uniref:Uncharacterized protein n=1 Tax=Acinetobacter baylyi (strain ATCC 33305 / BD413 / ADP1) TaxID=62977 RepID=Q6FAD1_ACIAD|nr:MULTISPECIES: hypothetical protein [Acinetobacter]ENV53918.1 hypothetical protein F952_01971 [Acinetobacter baylyi DSM 14961 = CIP 107474]KAF2373117.1 hypothetical protein BSL88_00315 [Acinetobacter baylyi]KAF2374468.1 hypothetical protein BSL67_07605 [Acinetobacter baylyi]KAF2377161.1 hypothetical protein BSN81_09860 [Acinetobacter baylyi]KAF2380949.1 hypothetical protein BSN83_07400 [Acinetobacter baylyi]
MSAQQFKLIHNFEEITSRPNFIDSVHISQNENGVRIKDLVGHYQFKERIKCGIAQCGTKHLKGYIVKLTNGFEIVIGHVCGRNNFGVDFTNKEREFNTQRIHAEQYQALKEIFDKLPELQQQFEEVLEQTGRFTFIDIKMGIKALQNDAFDYWMNQMIKAKITSKGLITEEQFKTEQEKEIDEEFSQGWGKKQYVRDTKTVTLAVIDEYDLVAQWHEAEKLKVYFERIHREIRNPAGMPNDLFKKLIKDLKEYEHNLKELKNFCIRGNRLLTQENLMKLGILFKKPDELRKVKVFAARFG